MSSEDFEGYQPVQLRALRRLLPEFEAEVKSIDGR